LNVGVPRAASLFHFLVLLGPGRLHLLALVAGMRKVPQSAFIQPLDDRVLADITQAPLLPGPANLRHRLCGQQESGVIREREGPHLSVRANLLLLATSGRDNLTLLFNFAASSLESLESNRFVFTLPSKGLSGGEKTLSLSPRSVVWPPHAFCLLGRAAGRSPI